jgi:hypothetical protein
MAALLKPGGTFYLSTPVGRERVVFNAHRVFDPRTIVRLAEASGLALQRLTLVQPSGCIDAADPTASELARIARATYHLGIFTFVKR